jgi:hypothetical protein
MFVENDLQAYEFGDYVLVKDLTHVNDIQPVLEDTEYWEKGDLFISMRQGSTVFLYRPSTNEIVWKKRGPWLYQHDVDILDSSRISVFGNDVFYVHWSRSMPGEHYSWFLSDHNDVYVYDFSSDQLSMPYTEMFKALNIATETQGRSEIFEDGSIYVEETDLGRYLYFFADSLHWQFGFKTPGKMLLMPSWSRLLVQESDQRFKE